MSAAPSFPSPAQLAKSARAQAEQTIAATIAALHRQQQDSLAQARARQAEIGKAATGAASFLSGLGDQTASDYQAALANQTGLASGYAGQTRSDAEAEVAKANGLLAPAGVAPVESKGGSLANLLYGLGGSLPGQALNVQGLGATTAARALPAATLGYGLQEGYGALAAGKREADALAPQISAAQAQRPGLIQQALAELASTVRDQALAQSLIQSRSDAATQAQNTLAESERYHRSSLAESAKEHQATLASQAADRRATAQWRADSAKATAAYRAGQLSISEFNAETGRINARLAAVKAKTAAKADQTQGGLTATGWRVLVGNASKLARDLAKTVPAQQHYDNGTATAVPGTGHGPTSYQDALAQLTALGPDTPRWRTKALQLVNAQPAYAPGRNGRPFSPAAARSLALRTARRGYEKGVPASRALAGLLAVGINREVAQAAIRQAYFAEQPFSPVPGSKNYPQGG